MKNIKLLRQIKNFLGFRDYIYSNFSGEQKYRINRLNNSIEWYNSKTNKYE